ncbi:MAG: hypothetical protein KBO59_17390, partial [Achromobacter sp.]|nr:hypothetical protein [Achromobacter sp.]
MCAEPVTGSSFTPTRGRRGHRHAAHVEGRQRGEVRLEAVDQRFVVDHDEVVIGAVQRPRLGQPQGLQQAGRHGLGHWLLGREVHRQAVAGAAHLQLAAAGGEPQHLVLGAE